jgi:hypothetical protein
MQFSPSFSWWMAALALAVAVTVIIFAYRRTGKPLSRRLSATLITLRVVSVGLLLICLLEPTLIAREEVHRKANLLVLVDDSQSISLTDVDRRTGISVPRIDAVKEALVYREKGAMTDLADRFDIQFYQFSSDCVYVEKLNPTASGTLTDIGKAISKAAGEWRGQLTAGIVLVTDGGNNSGESPAEIVRQVGMPIHTVGIGSTEMPRDIRVAKVEVSPIAYADHLLPVRAAIKSSGYDGREVQVSLVADEGRTQGSSLLDSVSLTLDSQNGEQTVELQLKPQQEGIFNFSITVPAAPEELTAQNNVYPFFVKVVKAKLNVLYIDGRPRWEYTFLKRALQRDPNIELTYLVATKQNGYYPTQESQKARGSEGQLSDSPALRLSGLYDVLILGDISPSFFSSEQLNVINNFVEDRGGSVIFLGGKHSLGRGGVGESILRGMLPIQIGPGGARQVRGAFSPVLTSDGLRHSITRLSDDQMENIAIWRDLPALTQFYEGEGIKLGATVLAEHQRERRQQVIAFQRYGNGIVLMIASDSLWRWAFGAYPFGGDDSHYRRFWSGTIRWLASIRTKADLVNVETDKGSYHRDEKVRVTAYVYDESYAPVTDAQLKARISILDTRLSMPDAGEGKAPAEPYPVSSTKFTSDGSGRYSAEFTPARDGHYEIQVEAHHAGRLLGENSTEFIVQTTALEFQKTQLEEAFLRNLADISGGSYHHLKDISDLPSSIEELSDTYTFVRERGLWDNGIILMIAVALLGTEWLLRKRKGLVDFSLKKARRLASRLSGFPAFRLSGFLVLSLAFAVLSLAQDEDRFVIARVKYGGGGDWYVGQTQIPNLQEVSRQ